MTTEVEQLTKDASGWLHQLLAGGAVQVASNQAANVLAAQQWLADINTGVLVVTESHHSGGDEQHPENYDDDGNAEQKDSAD